MIIKNDRSLIPKAIDELETNGFITITDGSKEVLIQSVDDKEGYSFVSSTNEEFANSSAAVRWGFDQFNH